MSKKEEEVRSKIFIVLECGEVVTLTHNKSIFEEVFTELRKAMKTGNELSLDGSYDVDMEDEAGNYLASLNGRKIVGFNS